MIKTIGLIKRRPELSHAQFIDHWTNVHAEMAKAFPQIRRYHLNYVLEEPARTGMASWDIRGATPRLWTGRQRRGRTRWQFGARTSGVALAAQPGTGPTALPDR
jgi:hypothetical protein